MARHRVAPARAATPTPAPAAPPAPSAPVGAATATVDRGQAEQPDLGALLPRQGLTEAHPSGPLPRSRRASPRRAHDPARDPHTSPLDLAAIALAAAKERRTGLPATGTSPAGGPVARTAADEPLEGPTTGGTPRPAYPAAVPSALAPPTPSHPLPAMGRGGRPDPRRRVALPTRTAGALALVGALAGGGVAVVGGGTMLTTDRTPDTAQFAAPDLAAASGPRDAAAPPAAHAADRGDQQRERHTSAQGGRHRADGTGASSTSSSGTGGY